MIEYFQTKYNQKLGVAIQHKLIRVLCANETSMYLISSRPLDLAPELLLRAQKDKNFNNMGKSYFSFIPVFCDANCEVVFTKQDIKVTIDNKVIMKENIDLSINLWLLLLNNNNNQLTTITVIPTTIQLYHTTNSTYHQLQSVSGLQAYHHASMCLVVSILLYAININ